MRVQAKLLHGEMKACGAVYAIAVKQRHCWHLV
jgi:hypothetical protein